MKVTYTSNNSGGSWWLNDEDWFALEKAGWVVDWCLNAAGERTRWLGALARDAYREGLSLEDAIQEWENATGLNSMSVGCSCCGQPHEFTVYDDNGKYVDSGPDVYYRR